MEKENNVKRSDVEDSKRRSILNAAMVEFCHGYEKASTDRIVKSAGVSKGLLFHHFGSLAGTGFLPELSAVVGGAGNAFLAIVAYILAQVVTAYAIMVILRMREEESLTRAELVLASAVSRKRYAVSHLLIAFAGSAAAIALYGLCIGDVASCMTRLPAVWLLASVVVFIYGYAPRAVTPVGWGLFGASLLLEFLWEIKVVGRGVFALSLFAWVYPGVTVTLLPILTMLLAAALLAGLGLVGFTHRDLTAE